MANTPTIYWHDYETFGLSKHVDRPAQFAGLRTDMDMNPLSEPDIWYCRPSPDYLPQADACMVTGITPQETAQKGLPEVEFARRIHQAFNTPGTLVVGYNNFKFDDEVSRALFWRNLMDMYSHQFRHFCSRWDLYPFVLAVWALRDEGIVWPKRGGEDPETKDLVTFRLEKLSEANHIEHTHAHDAASDVEATMLFAKFIKEKQPRLWQWALDHRDKASVRDALSSGKPCVWIDPYAGQKRGFIRIVIPVSETTDNRNDVYVWDCRYDPSELENMDSKELWRRAFAPKSERGQDEPRLPLCSLKLNQSPFVCASLGVVNARVCARFGIDMNEVLQNADKLIRILPLVRSTVLDAVRAKDEGREAVDDVDRALYNSFMGEVDRDLANSVLKLTPKDLAQRSREGRINFEDPKLNELLFRLRAHSYPETLDADELARFKKHAREMVSGKYTDRPSLSEYFETLDALHEKNEQDLENELISPEKAQLRSDVLDALYSWGEYVAEFSQNDDEGARQ